MKKAFRTLCAALALALCLCLPAFAQEPKPAQPAAKEEKIVTDLTGFDNFLRDSVGFSTNFGGPYNFAQAEHKSPAQAYGETPAEGTVALLRLLSRANGDTHPSVDFSGHAFIVITNVSQQNINVGGLLIAPGTSLTIGTRGNRSEHSGIWYNLEGYYKYYLPDDYYVDLYGIQVSLDPSQLDTVNQNLATADHWSAVYNCAAFSASLWNSVCSDPLSAGVPPTPAGLQVELQVKYADKLVKNPAVPYDYLVYYGSDPTLSKEYN